MENERHENEVLLLNEQLSDEIKNWKLHEQPGIKRNETVMKKFKTGRYEYDTNKEEYGLKNEKNGDCSCGE